MTVRWLREFARYVRCSPSFLHEMDQQLASAFAERTGLAITGFALGPEGTEMFVVESSRLIRFVRASLVGSRLGFAVTIAWVDPSRRRVVEPTDRVGESDVVFWWHELPVDEIRAEEAKVPVAPFDLARFPFPVRFAVKIWPDVRLVITLGRDLVDDDLDRIAGRLVATQNAWNGSDACTGTIHLIGEARRLDARRASFDVDLGSAGPAALERLLEELATSTDIAAVAVTSD